MGDALSRQRQPLGSTTAMRNRTTRSVSSGFTCGTPKQVALPYCRRASTLRRKPIAYGRRPQRTEIWGCCGSPCRGPRHSDLRRNAAHGQCVLGKCAPRGYPWAAHTRLRARARTARTQSATTAHVHARGDTRTHTHPRARTRDVRTHSEQTTTQQAGPSTSAVPASRS